MKWNKRILDSDRTRYLVIACVMIGIFISFLSAVQFSTPDMPDNDGFYHIMMANLMRTQGLKPLFPWLPLTILNPREFYDHHFLFHAALIPFTFGDLRLGAKVAAVVFASVTFFIIWRFFYSQRLHYSWLWALGLLAISEAFIFRMSITRAQSLSLAILVLGMDWLIRKKHKRLAVLAFFYVWTYDGFPLLPAMGLLYGISIWLVEKRVDFRPLLYTLLGTVLGLILNPYFPFDLIFIFRHLLPKVSGISDVRVGNEWYPYDTGQLLRNSPLAILAFISGILALGVRGEKMDVRTCLAFLMSILTGWMLFQSRRFVEYFPAFSLIFAAFAWSPIIDASQVSPSKSNQQDKPMDGTRLPFNWREEVKKVSPFLILVPLILFGSYATLRNSIKSIQGSKSYSLYEGASRWLIENTPAGERVFQTDWDDFPRLFYYNTHNTYLIGLDPTYMQLYNPDLYATWVAITRGEVIQPSGVIYSKFGSRYVISDLKHDAFLKKASQDLGMIEVYRDSQAIIFQVNR